MAILSKTTLKRGKCPLKGLPVLAANTVSAITFHPVMPPAPMAVRLVTHKGVAVNMPGVAGMAIPNMGRAIVSVRRT